MMMVYNLNFLSSLIDGLEVEIRDSSLSIASKSTLLVRVTCFQSKLNEYMNDIEMGDSWFELYNEYLDINRLKANELNKISSLSQVYPTMFDFWSDAASQEKGESRNTFWDVYEHGRRRQLEFLLSKHYGSSSSLLVNSGMSAISVAVESQNLSSGDVLLTTSKSFFETSELMSKSLSSRGVDVVRVPSSDIKRAIDEYKPKVIYLETVVNAPTAPCIEMVDDWESIGESTVVIIDNTVQSHATRYFAGELNLADNYLIVESGTKYLSEDISLGVVYGSVGLVDNARAYARNTGQQLQEKCFNYLSEANIKYAKDRLALHSRNVGEFIHTLISEVHEEIEFLRPLDINRKNGTVFKSGVGAIIYLKFKNDSLEMNRDVLHRWHGDCRTQGNPINIQAGFGWSRTMARVYESSFLNQKDAPNYIRISIGIEPLLNIVKIAKALANAIKNERL